MLSGEPGPPIVVAVGADSDGQAVDWAAAEAAARGCQLHVVHVERLRWAVDPSGLVPVVDVSSYRLAAEDVLRTAVRRAHAVAPDLEISEEALFGATRRLLVLQGRRAQLLVLGARPVGSERSPRGLLAHVRRAAVTRRSSCPVAIVGPLRSSPPVGARPRVVVGVDGSVACAPVLGVAFEAAAQRGVPVTVVHGWTPGVPAGRTVERVLEPWRNRFPDVPVDTQLSCTDPADALIRESEGAALVVVGRRGRGAVRSVLLGSGRRRVVERAGCPVVVVRTVTARTTRSTATPWPAQLAEPGGAATMTALDTDTDRAGDDVVRRRRPTWE